jgi:hypothetical protein
LAIKEHSSARVRGKSFHKAILLQASCHPKHAILLDNLSQFRRELVVKPKSESGTEPFPPGNFLSIFRFAVPPSNGPGE